MSSSPRKAINRVLRRFGLEISRIPKHPQPEPALPPSTEAVLERLDEPFRSRLLSMYEGNPQRGFDGQIHTLDDLTRISPAQGMWIHDLCLSAKPQSTLEIGMAYGFSTVYFLAALAKNGQGKHTAIDPFQKSGWHGIGLTVATELAATLSDPSGLRFIEDRSDRAATDLVREKQLFDIVFVDGNHRYDDVLVDFYLYAQIVSNGGYIILDDMWMSSVKTVAEFIRTNRPDFREIASPVSNIAVFQKVGEDYRNWDEFSTFNVFPSSGVPQPTETS